MGQYSYVGDDGKTYTVRYSAGRDGFRILSGDHIPSGGQNVPSAAVASVVGPNNAVVEEEYDYQYYDDTPQQSVFVNPHDPSHYQARYFALHIENNGFNLRTLFMLYRFVLFV